MNDSTAEIWNQQVLAQSAWLRTVVRSRVLSPEEADDVFQSIMTEALAFRDRRHEVRSLGPWLYRLAVNSVLQLRRKRGRQRKLTHQYSESIPRHESREPLCKLLGDEQQTLVRRAMERLDGEDLEILLLKYVHGWNYHQISEQLGLELAKVAHRLRRARTRLKQHCLVQGLDGTG